MKGLFYFAAAKNYSLPFANFMPRTGTRIGFRCAKHVSGGTCDATLQFPLPRSQSMRSAVLVVLMGMVTIPVLADTLFRSWQGVHKKRYSSPEE